MRAVSPDIALISASLHPGPISASLNPPKGGAQLPSCPWVMLLDDSEPHQVVAAFRAGAKGVFSRTQSDMRLPAKCIRRMMEGQVWVDSKEMMYLLDAFAGNGEGKLEGQGGPPPKLTRREESVVRLVMQGMVNRVIAHELQLSEHTVKNYLSRIFDKLGVSNQVELALYAVAKLKLDEDAAA